VWMLAMTSVLFKSMLCLAATQRLATGDYWLLGLVCNVF
jgi:hypothetical protein